MIYNQSIKILKKPLELKKKDKEETFSRNYAEILYLCNEKGWTILELLSEITKGLGVGISIEIMRSYFAFFQTSCGVKGTNVILIGESGQGKSWTIEGALNLITHENVVYGTMTESAFFEGYTGKDVTGLTFFLGDLGGGETDDEKTIRFKNVLKQLTSEGKVKDTINKDGIATGREVTGYPAIAYTTADESIINEQEKSRSFIGYPPPADTRQIVTFNALMNGKGMSKKTLEEIKKISKQFKSVVHHFKSNLTNYILFNPYMYDVREILKEDKNFNRKIKEFDELLRIVAVLSDPYIINLKTGKQTLEDKDKITENHLLITTKQNNIDALVLLNNNNGLLAPDIDLVNGLLRKFDHYEENIIGQEQLVEDPTLYIEELKNNSIHDDGSYDTSYCFTGDDLKIRYKTKDWLLKNKTYIFQKLRRLAEEGLIIKIGSVKSTKQNIYSLAPSFISPIKTGIPVFKHKNFHDGLKLLKIEYPELYNDVENFLNNDFKQEIDTVSFNTGNCRLFKLLWEDEAFTKVES